MSIPPHDRGKLHRPCSISATPTSSALLLVSPPPRNPVDSFLRYEGHGSLFLAPARSDALETYPARLRDPMDAFFVSWLARLDELRSDLLAALIHRPHLILPAVDAILDHYREYRDARARHADADVLDVISHSWLTPFERTFLWVAGWKPSLAFRLLFHEGGDGGRDGCLLWPDQRTAMEELRRQVVAAEHRISEGLAEAQEAMASQAVLGAVRAGSRNVSARAAAADVVARALRAVVSAADELRDATLRQVVEILTPAQAAEFLALAAELRLRVHRWGLRRNG
ncbi:protein DOG1-like 4 [Musa acuminata AAA Group]|uniref:protein DOG1-like 4 n=1 Tax=Musa acuminata AAA Group TaxID=214697 RepID=UPI0031D4F877